MRLDLRAEQKRVAVPPVVKRLDAQAVARGEQRRLRAIPDRKREHAPQMFHAVAAVLFIEVNDGFGVASRAVAVASGFELGAQLGVVVDFTVEDDPNVLILVGERLVAGLRRR